MIVALLCVFCLLHPLSATGRSSPSITSAIMLPMALMMISMIAMIFIVSLPCAFACRCAMIAAMSPSSNGRMNASTRGSIGDSCIGCLA